LNEVGVKKEFPSGSYFNYNWSDDEESLDEGDISERGAQDKSKVQNWLMNVARRSKEDSNVKEAIE
jgi:hypothetical protein